MKLKGKLELAGINPAEIGGYRLYDMEPRKGQEGCGIYMSGIGIIVLSY